MKFPTLAFLISLVLSPIALAQTYMVPHSGLPKHVQACLTEHAVTEGLLLHRLAGLTEEEALTSLGYSMKILAYQMEQYPNWPRKMPPEQAEQEAREMIEQIYDLDPFSQPIANAFVKRLINECIEEAEAGMQQEREEEKRKEREGERLA